MKINDLKIGDRIKYRDNTWGIDRKATITQINELTINVVHESEFTFLNYYNIPKKDIISKITIN